MLALPGGRVAVRRLGPDDWQLRRDLRLRALQESPHAFWSTYQDDAGRDDGRWQSALDPDSDRAAWVVELDDEAVGMVSTFIDRNGASGSAPDPETAHLVGLWVDPVVRGRRLASLLVEAVVAWARERELRRVSLWVVDTNDGAGRLYARHGFRPTGRTGAFPEPRAQLAEHEEELLLG